ncbi:hypothetical protein [Phyllobacterium leguminum]|uniref:hypothetical protein n=1 Tax=Phyllobacterium leguminum TaxID=314237 RepID=UPI001FDED0E4|nr:hypothetical protein [Phyllobacterium leguminum]
MDKSNDPDRILCNQNMFILARQELPEPGRRKMAQGIIGKKRIHSIVKISVKPHLQPNCGQAGGILNIRLSYHFPIIALSPSMGAAINQPLY